MPARRDEAGFVARLLAQQILLENRGLVWLIGWWVEGITWGAKMRTLLRAVAGLNALFQILIGVAAILSPVAAAKLFELGDLAPPSLALIRMFGGLLAGSGLLSGLIALNPEANPSLLVAYALTCLLNLAADTLVGLSGALHFSQLAFGMLLQILVVIAVGLYRRARAPS